MCYYSLKLTETFFPMFPQTGRLPYDFAQKIIMLKIVTLVILYSQKKPLTFDKTYIFFLLVNAVNAVVI